MPSVNTSGTQTATLATEHTLATVTTPGTYVLAVDARNLAMGDVLELRLYAKVLSTSTAGVAYQVAYAQVQGEPVKLSVPIPITHYVQATLKQTAGTGRSFDWELISL